MTSPSSAQSTSQQLVTQVPKGTGIEKKKKKTVRIENPFQKQFIVSV